MQIWNKEEVLPNTSYETNAWPWYWRLVYFVLPTLWIWNQGCSEPEKSHQCTARGSKAVLLQSLQLQILLSSPCEVTHQGPELPKVKRIGCTNCENDLEHNDCRRSHPRKDNLTQSNTIEGQSLKAAFSGIIELFMKHREGKKWMESDNFYMWWKRQIVEVWQKCEQNIPEMVFFYCVTFTPKLL